MAPFFFLLGRGVTTITMSSNGWQLFFFSPNFSVETFWRLFLYSYFLLLYIIYRAGPRVFAFLWASTTPFWLFATQGELFFGENPPRWATGGVKFLDFFLKILLFWLPFFFFCVILFAVRGPKIIFFIYASFKLECVFGAKHWPF